MHAKTPSSSSSEGVCILPESQRCWGENSMKYQVFSAGFIFLTLSDSAIGDLKMWCHIETYSNVLCYTLHSSATHNSVIHTLRWTHLHTPNNHFVIDLYCFRVPFHHLQLCSSYTLVLKWNYNIYSGALLYNCPALRRNRITTIFLRSQWRSQNDGLNRGFSLAMIGSLLQEPILRKTTIFRQLIGGFKMAAG